MTSRQCASRTLIERRKNARLQSICKKRINICSHADEPPIYGPGVYDNYILGKVITIIDSEIET